MPIDQIEDIDDQDVEYQLSELLDKFSVDPLYKYHEIVSTPQSFIKFIKNKLITDFDLLIEKNLNDDDAHAYPINK